MMTVKLVSLVQLPKGSEWKYQILLELTPRWFDRHILGRTKTYPIYHGEYSEWHEYPSGIQAPAWLALIIIDFVEGAKMKGQL
jgi:hypothetical protein